MTTILQSPLIRQCWLKLAITTKSTTTAVTTKQLFKQLPYIYNKTHTIHTTCYKTQQIRQANTTSSQDDLIIDNSVIERLQHVQQLRSKQQNNNEPLLLRIAVDAGGCSGFSYSFKFDTADNINKDDDIIYTFDDSKNSVIIDSLSLSLIKGSKLRWNVDGLVRAAFAIVDNPNAESKCGCGSSFNPKQVEL